MSHFSWLLNTCHWIDDIFEGVRSWPDYQLTNLSHFSWLLNTCHWIDDIFEGVRSWPDYQLTNLSHFSWLLNTCHWIGDIFDGVRSWPDYQLTNFSHFSWLLNTCHWIDDIFEGVRSWPDYQLTNLSHFSWLLNTCHWIGDIFEGVQSCAVYQLINCHTDVDWWLLVIELVIFLKVSGFGLITKFQFCHIEVDWWLLYIKLVIFLHTDLIQWQFPVNFNVRYLWTGIIPNFNTVTLSILNFLAANLKVSRVGLITNSQICHISVDCWILVIEMVILPTLKAVHWVGPELARLPTHKFVTFQLTGDYLLLNWWYFWRCPDLLDNQVSILSHFSWLLNTCHWIGDIFDGVRSWPDYQLTNFSHFSWLLSTWQWIGDIFEGVQSCAVYQLINCHTDVDWWLLVIELVIFLKVSGFGLITKFQFCHIEVDWWLLYIKLVIFLHTDLIQWQFPVNFNVRYLWTGIIPNFNTVTLSILNFLAANLKVSGVGLITNSQICHISVDCWILVIEWWYFWRSPELARLPTHKFVTFQLTAE